MSEEIITKEALKEALKKIFSCLEYDQLLWPLTGDEVNFEKPFEEVLDIVTDMYTEKLYPVIVDKFEEVPYMRGHDATGKRFFEHEFMYHPAKNIYYEVEEYYGDGTTDMMLESDVYILTSGEVMEVETFHVKSGDFDMEYKSQIGYIVNPDDYYFEENVLFETLDAIAEREDTDESEVA